MLASLIFAVLFACGSAQDPSCAYITAQPQYMHPGVPQAAAEQKCRTDCAQPGYNCETIAHYYPTICTCGTSPSTPPPTPAPTTPTPGVCSNVAYHQCGGNDGYTGDTCCPYYQGQQQICHRESDQYWQCCPPSLAGCGAAFWTPYKNPKAAKPAVAAPKELVYVGNTTISYMTSQLRGLVGASSETTTSNACLSRVNYWRAKHGKPAYKSNDSKNSCTAGQASNDKAKGYHKAFGKCGEHGQCEGQGFSDCAACIDQYYKEGPGSGSAHGHYNLIMGNYKSMSWGRAGTFWSQDFFN